MFVCLLGLASVVHSFVALLLSSNVQPLLDFLEWGSHNA